MYKFCPNPKHLIGLWKNECLASSNPSMNQRTELRFDLLNSLLVVWVLPIWPPSETREKEQERGRKREIERKRREKGRKGKEKGWRKDFLKEYQQKLGLPNKQDEDNQQDHNKRILYKWNMINESTQTLESAMCPLIHR